MSYSFEIDAKLTESLRKLDSAFAKAYVSLSKCSEQELQALHKYAKISMIGASTRIENAQLTDPEVHWLDTILTEDGKTTALDQNRALIENKLSKDRERSIEEVAGCRAMLMLIYEDHEEFFPLKEVDIRSLHHTLLTPHKKSALHAGKYKTLPNSVIEKNHHTGETRTIFKTADPGPITNAAMSELVDWYNKILPILTKPVIVASEFVYRFLAIHPFQDGNGRLGRGLFLLCLLQSREEITTFVSRYLAIDRYIEKHKEEYYAVLNRCSEGKFQQDPKRYKIFYFLKFMIKILHESIDGLESIKERYRQEQNLSESASKVLQCFKDYPEIRLTTAKIIEEIELPRRTVIYSLNTLLDAQLIQKYRKGASTQYQLTF